MYIIPINYCEWNSFFFDTFIWKYILYTYTIYNIAVQRSLRTYTLVRLFLCFWITSLLQEPNIGPPNDKDRIVQIWEELTWELKFQKAFTFPRRCCSAGNPARAVRLSFTAQRLNFTVRDEEWVESFMAQRCETAP